MELKLTTSGIRVAPVFAGAAGVGCCWLPAAQDKTTKPGILLFSSGARKLLLFRCCAVITIIYFFIGCKFIQSFLMAMAVGKILFFQGRCRQREQISCINLSFVKSCVRMTDKAGCFRSNFSHRSTKTDRAVRYLRLRLSLIC
jgi:hypothetical protein